MQERRPEGMGLSCWEQKGDDCHAVPVGTLNRPGLGKVVGIQRKRWGLA